MKTRHLFEQTAFSLVVLAVLSGPGCIKFSSSFSSGCLAEIEIDTKTEFKDQEIIHKMRKWILANGLTEATAGSRKKLWAKTRSFTPTPEKMPNSFAYFSSGVPSTSISKNNCHVELYWFSLNEFSNNSRARNGNTSRAKVKAKSDRIYVILSMQNTGSTSSRKRQEKKASKFINDFYNKFEKEFDESDKAKFEFHAPKYSSRSSKNNI